MPTFKDKAGNSRFAMNPQQGAALIGGPSAGDPTDPAAATDPDADGVEIHKGGNPMGQPPPSESTQYHTIHGTDIRNHDDYDSADAHMKECMGADGMSSADYGDDGGDSGDME